MNKAQLKILVIGIPGIIGMSFFSRFYTDTYNSLDIVHKMYLSELLAACIAITIFVIRKKLKTDLLEPYELLMIIIIGAIAGVNLIPPDVFDANWIIGSSIIILVAWFSYFGLGNYLGEDKKIESATFLLMLLMFIGLTIVIMVAFNFHRIIQLFTPDPV